MHTEQGRMILRKVMTQIKSQKQRKKIYDVEHKDMTLKTSRKKYESQKKMECDL